MQREKPFRREHLEALLPYFEHKPWRVDDFGVWPEVDFENCERLGLSSEYGVLSWKPVTVFKDDEPAPDCKNTPGLPFPFGADDLAAFMLNGVGSFVADFYGEWEDGPEKDRLDAIDPGNNFARQAVRSAFDAYREAKRAIGCPEDEDPDTEAMVRELLKPRVATSKAAQAQAATRAPVAQDISGNSKEKRQADRWQKCIEAGLPMPQDTYAQLPRGMREIANSLGISRQALAQDLNAHRERLFGK